MERSEERGVSGGVGAGGVGEGIEFRRVRAAVEEGASRARAAAVVLGYAVQAKVASLQALVEIEGIARAMSEEIERRLEERPVVIDDEIRTRQYAREERLKQSGLLEEWARLSYVRLACIDRIMREVPRLEVDLLGKKGKDRRGGDSGGSEVGVSGMSVRATRRVREALKGERDEGEAAD